MRQGDWRKSKSFVDTHVRFTIRNQFQFDELAEGPVHGGEELFSNEGLTVRAQRFVVNMNRNL